MFTCRHAAARFRWSGESDELGAHLSSEHQRPSYGDGGTEVVAPKTCSQCPEGRRPRATTSCRETIQGNDPTTTPSVSSQASQDFLGAACRRDLYIQGEPRERTPFTPEFTSSPKVRNADFLAAFEGGGLKWNEDGLWGMRMEIQQMQHVRRDDTDPDTRRRISRRFGHCSREFRRLHSETRPGCARRGRTGLVEQDEVVNDARASADASEEFRRQDYIPRLVWLEICSGVGGCDLGRRTDQRRAHGLHPPHSSGPWTCCIAHGGGASLHCGTRQGHLCDSWVPRRRREVYVAEIKAG